MVKQEEPKDDDSFVSEDDWFKGYMLSSLMNSDDMGLNFTQLQPTQTSMSSDLLFTQLKTALEDSSRMRGPPAGISEPTSDDDETPAEPEPEQQQDQTKKKVKDLLTQIEKSINVRETLFLINRLNDILTKIDKDNVDELDFEHPSFESSKKVIYCFRDDNDNLFVYNYARELMEESIFTGYIEPQDVDQVVFGYENSFLFAQANPVNNSFTFIVPIAFESKNDKINCKINLASYQNLIETALNVLKMTDDAKQYDNYEKPLTIDKSCEIIPGDFSVTLPNIFYSIKQNIPTKLNCIQSVLLSKLGYSKYVKIMDVIDMAKLSSVLKKK